MTQKTVFFAIIAVLLLIWGGTDLYHYFAIGRDMLTHYGEEVIGELVNYSLTQGIIKIALAAVAAVLAFLCRKKKKD